MPEYGGRSYPAVCPYLYYRDTDAALAFLTAACGFRERMRSAGDDGLVSHAELELGDSVVMIGRVPDARADTMGGGVYVHVEDVDGHFGRAKAAGAAVQDEPADQPYGVRSYGLEDPEGHQWWFAQPLERAVTGAV